MKLKHYFKSFQFNRLFWEVFAIDFIFFSILGISFSVVSNLLLSWSNKAMGGMNVDQMQNFFTTASPEQMLPIATIMRNYLLSAILILLAMAVIYFLLYSFTRGLIWNHLSKKKLTKKTYWKWNSLNLALILPIVLYGFVAALVKLLFIVILRFFFTLNPTFYVKYENIFDGFFLILNGLMNLIIVLVALTIIFLAYHTFTQKYKVWESVGNAFHLFKLHWSKLWPLLLLATLTAGILTLVLLPLKSWLQYQTFILTTVNLIISVFYLAWFRIYLVKTIS
jgi:hypothetical protein